MEEGVTGVQELQELQNRGALSLCRGVRRGYRNLVGRYSQCESGQARAMSEICDSCAPVTPELLQLLPSCISDDASVL